MNAGVWTSRNIRGEQDPFHSIALPPSFMPPKLPGSSIDPDARPTFEQACEVLRGRLADLRGYIEKLTQEELVRPIEGHAGTVGGGLGVTFNEADRARPLHQLIVADLDWPAAICGRTGEHRG